MSAKTISYNVPFADTRTYAKQGGLKDKVVVITGAGSGFGRDLAIELVGFGSKLVICDINSKGLENTSKEITKLGGEVVSQVVNVASWDQQLSLFEAGFKRFGKIDIVVANAGISEPTDNPNNPDIFPLKEQDVSIPPPQPSIRVIDINLTGVFYTMRLGFHYLRKGEKRSGRAIISVGSMASFTAVPTAPLYSATKAGVLGLVKSASDLSNGFLKDEGIRISMIAPFFALTNLIEAPLRKVLSDLPLASVEDVVGSMIHSMTPLDPKADPPILNGQIYTVPDSKGTFVIPSKVSQLVLYRELIERTGEIGRRSGQAIAKFSREMAERKTSKL